MRDGVPTASFEAQSQGSPKPAAGKRGKIPLKKRLTSVGLTTKQTEVATNRSIINTCYVLEGTMSCAELVQRLEDPERGVVRFDRFRSRVEEDCFVEIPDYSCAGQVKEMHVPKGIPPEDHEKWLLMHVGTHGTEAFRPSLPPWEFTVIPGYKDTQCVLHFRGHHLLADGAGLVLALSGLVDEQMPLPKGGKRAARGLLAPLLDCAKLVAYWMVMLIGVVRLAWKMLRSFVLIPAKSPFKGDLGTTKCLAVRESFALDEVKRVGQRVVPGRRCTLNDVMLAAIAGSLRKWMLQRGPVKSSLLCAVPVNLRTKHELYVGNKIGALTVALPVEEADRIARIRKTADRMGTAKALPEALLGYWLSTLSFVLPPPVLRWVMGQATSRVSLAVTNVQGPPMKLHMLGRAVVSTVGIVPPPPGVAVGIAIVTRQGRVSVSVSSDQTLLGGAFAEELSRGIDDELRAMGAAGS